MFSSIFWPMNRRFCLFMLVVLLVACGGEKDETPEATSTPAPVQPTATLAPIETEAATLDPQLRPTLEAQYESLRQSQQQIETIWRDLQAGQAVPCSTEITTPISPQALNSDDPVSQTLFRAAVSIDQAITSWQAECQNPRQQPPPDVIDRGVLTALAAGDALREAATLLSR